MKGPYADKVSPIFHRVYLFPRLRGDHRVWHEYGRWHYRVDQRDHVVKKWWVPIPRH